ncbi:MAG: ABC transporter substrate-binding protein [Deinococcota bacterium]
MKHLVNFITLTALTLTSFAFAQETRQYTDDLGRTVEIPVIPQRIVSVRGEQFTAPLWELGANIVASSGRAREGVNDGEPFPRGAYDLFNVDFRNSGLIWVGSPNEPDFEAIIAAEPDLIFIPDWQEDLLPQFEVIAPTVVIAIHSQPAMERYRKIADAAGMSNEFEALKARWEARLALARRTIEQELGDPANVSVAVVNTFDGQFYIYGNWGALSQVLTELGFSEPQVIAELGDENQEFSPERIQEVDADFWVGLFYPYTQTVSAIHDNFDALVPGWNELLHAPRNNQFFIINQEPMRALSFRSLEETLAIVTSQIAQRDFVPLEE